ncbi:MAG TPA: metallophosphoesterase [Longimicrobiales bacterium]|nr:metallophosphoesterase [Longimicrobiales bacterium]
MTLKPLRLFTGILALAATAAGCASLEGGARELPSRFPDAPRIVAIGDVHGDLDAARRALRLAGAIDEQDRWVGGRLVVVQTGDQTDRGDDERAILRLFDRLTVQAARAGGAFHALNGNHELMNALLDLRYVTEGGFADFADVATHLHADSALAEWPPEQRGRVLAFTPGGEYALLLAKRNTIVMVGGNVFVHGGVLPHHAEYGIENINGEIRAWLRGEGEQPQWVRGSDTPIWTRLYSQNPDDEACATVAQALETLGGQRMIVGHTVHRQGVTSYCDGRIWAIDVGLAEYYGGPMEVLEISGGGARPLRAEPSTSGG